MYYWNEKFTTSIKGLSNRFEVAEERISELEDKLTKYVSWETERKTNEGKWKGPQRNGDTKKHKNICKMRVPEGERKYSGKISF